MIIEQLWLKLVKVKWPTLVVGSEDYNNRRKAFFMGCMTMITVVVKVPDRVLEILMPKLANELKSELGRGDAEIIKDNSNLS